ncbi:SphA family protein [Photobacterium sp. DNB22_13_2]
MRAILASSFFLLCLVLLLLTSLGMLPRKVKAEEGVSGHYRPGSLSSRFNKLPPSHSVKTYVDLSKYEGNTQGGLSIPLAGLVVTDLDVKSQTSSLNFTWNPGIELKGGWQYAMAISLPYSSVEVSARESNDAGGRGQRQRDKDSGLGDIMFSPLMLAYSISEYWQSEFHFNIYAPTGNFEVDKLANVGKNYWSFSPVAWLQYIEPVTGQEFTVSAGLDWNSKNDDTGYQTGAQMHIDSTVIQYIPLLRGFTGIGLSGYWYQQISADSGSGAVLGDFKAKAVGLGPVLSYQSKWSGRPVRVEFKWINELEVQNRPEGDLISLKLLAQF